MASTAAAHDLAQRHVLFGQRHLPGLDLAQVKDIVDQARIGAGCCAG